MQTTPQTADDFRAEAERYALGHAHEGKSLAELLDEFYGDADAEPELIGAMLS